MSLNIKNKDAHKLARLLAGMTGESMTEAVTEAIRERLARVQDKDVEKRTGNLSDRLLEIGRDCALRLKEPFRSADHGDFLYDEKGLPK
jgi:antitoxin VapB